MAKKTLVAVLASHDSVSKNNELIEVFEKLHELDQPEILKSFHFVFTGGTYRRLFAPRRLPDEIKTLKTLGPASLKNVIRALEEVKEFEGIGPMNKDVKDFIIKQCGVTVLPDRKLGGVTILSNLIVHSQCSIIWPFLSSLTSHWLNPENLALMRLCDFWNVKRLMNRASVEEWFKHEAERDAKRLPQKVNPLDVRLVTTPVKKTGAKKKGTKAVEGLKVKKNTKTGCYEVNVAQPPKRRVMLPLEKQRIALIAHDDVKPRMIRFAAQYEEVLMKFERILTTGTTGSEVEKACSRLCSLGKVVKCQSGPKGGDIEIATEILANRCHVVIFFVDPLNPHPHIDDIRVVFGACMREQPNSTVHMFTNEFHAREWMEEVIRR
ncbi:MAG: methylglyoxal synthase [candidate division Zixibacteria bacterium]|nr:methylglyoxal synthase [candidate division Zixibacteria bacterium]MDH3939214.1 methylglyoxal synthase [candidate division Zixibacteria bacterium]MDH4034248.1 methylglyoxal synthase [candidate division Zixibacteria bacterium]